MHQFQCSDGLQVYAYKADLVNISTTKIDKPSKDVCLFVEFLHTRDIRLAIDSVSIIANIATETHLNVDFWSFFSKCPDYFHRGDEKSLISSLLIRLGLEQTLKIITRAIKASHVPAYPKQSISRWLKMSEIASLISVDGMPVYIPNDRYRFTGEISISSLSVDYLLSNKIDKNKWPVVEMAGLLETLDTLDATVEEWRRQLSRHSWYLEIMCRTKPGAVIRINTDRMTIPEIRKAFWYLIEKSAKPDAIYSFLVKCCAISV